MQATIHNEFLTLTVDTHGAEAVSYTHLDVYKRQHWRTLALQSRALGPTPSKPMMPASSASPAEMCIRDRCARHRFYRKPRSS